MAGEQMPYPVRMPANPYAFEKVRTTTTFGNRRNRNSGWMRCAWRHELDVRLVEQHRGAGTNPLQEAFEVLGRFHRAGRVVRPAHHHDFRVGGGVGHGVEVVVSLFVQRHCDGLQPSHLREDRIAVECGCRHDNPVAGTGQPLQHLHDHAGGAGADDDLLLLETEVPRNEPAEPFRQELRIAVDRVDGPNHGGANRGQRSERALVEGQGQRIFGVGKPQRQGAG